MKKYEVNVILQPENNNKYGGRRYLKMEVSANNREEAIENVKAYMEGMLRDYVRLIVE